MEPSPSVSLILSLPALLPQLQKQSPSGIIFNSAHYSKPDGINKYPSKNSIYGLHLAFHKTSSVFAACSLAKFTCGSICKSSSFGSGITTLTSNALVFVISSWWLFFLTYWLFKSFCQQNSFPACRMVKAIGYSPREYVPLYVGRHHCLPRPNWLWGSWPKDTQCKFANQNRCPLHLGWQPGLSVREKSSHTVRDNTWSIYIIVFGRWT